MFRNFEIFDNYILFIQKGCFFVIKESKRPKIKSSKRYSFGDKKEKQEMMKKMSKSIDEEIKQKEKIESYIPPELGSTLYR